MKDFRLALVAQQSRVGHRPENLAAMESWLRQSKDAGAQFVCFPELNITGHGGHVAMIEEPEALPGGPACEQLIQWAKELDLYISAGICEIEGVVVYNTQFIVGPEGYLGKQRKLHLSSDEYFYFRHGSDLPVIDLPFAKVGTIICFDNEHPEPARCLALKGAELILAPHAARCLPKWPGSKKAQRQHVARQLDHWSKVHRARAWDNAAYVALCNAAGPACEDYPDVEANHAGCCMVLDPRGDIIRQSDQGLFREELMVVDLAAKPLHDTRNRPCLPLRVRRPENFRILTEPTA